MSREGEKYNFQKGEGINIVFGTKNRPLLRSKITNNNTYKNSVR
jgi:hypothetical protein